jgi:translation initiation factor eIF-2B subunit delta
MKEEYGDLHPKILDLGMRLINESYQSSNQRCIAMLLALKYFVYDFQVAPNKSLHREIQPDLDKIILFLQECRPFTTGVQFAMNFIKMSIASLNMKQTPEQQKKKIYEKIDYIINDRIILADETIV